jgi:hypothetical protein
LTALLFVPVSFGEAADKFTILQIKRERIRDPAKRANVETELALLSEPFLKAMGATQGFEALLAALKDINGRLWNIEEQIREHERWEDFGAEFVRLARAVYRTNEERTRVKREIDLLFESPILEEKSYVEHDPQTP